jgi:hypothetical protein
VIPGLRATPQFGSSDSYARNGNVLITVSGHSRQRCGKGNEMRSRDGRLELE